MPIRLIEPVAQTERANDQEHALPDRTHGGLRSLRALVLAGYAIVTVPLIVIVLAAAYGVNRFADKSQQVVYQSVLATQNSRILMEQLIGMERAARQYQVMQDPSLFSVYRDGHNQFVATIEDLMQSPDRPIIRAVQSLATREANLYNTLANAAANDKVVSAKTLNDFGELRDEARDAWLKSSRLVGRKVSLLDEAAHSLQATLLWASALLAPGTLALVLLFTWLIARPIRQLDAAINRLGDGKFEQPLAVRGPRDLEYLGERLDWLRRRLAELEQQKQKFLRTVSHELKTPLASLREGSGLLTDQVVGELNDEQREIVRLLQISGWKLQSQIENLLNYNRIQGQYFALNPRLVDLDALTERVLAEHQITLRARRLRVDKQLDKVRLWGDEELLKNVVDNLLSNAIKYSPVGGVLDIRLREQNPHASLIVSDQGPGIDPDEREKIFEIFYQGRAAREGKRSGTGIGLAIVREYVQAHRGSVHTKPSGLSPTGTSFIVELPLDLRKDVL
ncbi:MAG: HAMP domain-containing histidine kinase [Pseudomonadota bacterium]|nr:HAMP domain-containing histidine kinase [Pseudomonadota bacterium]